MRYEDHLAKVQVLHDEIARLRQEKPSQEDTIKYLIETAEVLLRAARLLIGMGSRKSPAADPGGQGGKDG